MNDYGAMPPSAHRLELVGREQLTISGVEDVERFDETGIVMSTTAGQWIKSTGELRNEKDWRSGCLKERISV